MASDTFDALKDAAADLLLAWARKAEPHYGPSGSMDLDLEDFADADGPSYYNQFAHFAYLLLSEGVAPGADADERDRFREIALGNLRYILRISDDEYHTPHYSRGRDWGRHIGEWINYFMLCSLEVMQRFGVGDADLRQGVANHVQGAVAQLADRFKARFADAPVSFPGNHATWHGLLFYRAGVFFDRSDWVDFAHDFFGRYILPTQRPNGVWPEGDGIVVNYSMVTAQAVSLYAEASGNADALASMGRALGFFQAFSLPDGSSAVAADCRMRYHARPMVFLPPSFWRCAEGRQMCLDRIRAYRAQLDEVDLTDNAAQGLAFYAASVDALMQWNQAGDSLVVVPSDDLPVARVDRGNWTGFLSWQLTPEHGSRFILDAQNYVEVWHAESGYLIGGGNSKYMPRFSTIRQINGGRAYVPDRAVCLEQTNTCAVCVYDFGEDRIQVRLSVDDAECRIGFRLLAHADGGEYEVGLMIALKPGETMHFGNETIAVQPTAMINRRFGKDLCSFVWRDRTFQAPVGAMLDYPLIPHNPYTQHGLPSEDAYIARLSIRVQDREQQVVIR